MHYKYWSVAIISHHERTWGFFNSVYMNNEQGIRNAEHKSVPDGILTDAGPNYRTSILCVYIQFSTQLFRYRKHDEGVSNIQYHTPSLFI